MNADKRKIYRYVKKTPNFILGVIFYDKLNNKYHYWKNTFHDFLK